MLWINPSSLSPASNKILMDQNSSSNSSDAATFGNVRNDSEGFRSVPNVSAPFGSVPHHSEGFRTIPKLSERKENQILTVREAARMFEAAGVARTERSIVNWCQLNSQHVARLDAYFDPNERRYYITPQSVEAAIAEEKAKAAKLNTPPSEPVGNVPYGSEAGGKQGADGSESESKRLTQLEKETLDLKILNKGKDFLIEQLRQERDGFFGQLLDASRKMGELETKLLQLESGTKNSAS